jgi:hypothetical protein
MRPERLWRLRDAPAPAFHPGRLHTPRRASIFILVNRGVTHPRFQPPVPPAGSPENLRQFGRLRCQDVECSLGTVLDISRGGMRVRMIRKLPRKIGAFTVRLAAMGLEAYVTCTVRWTRTLGLLRHEVGLAFEPVDEKTARVLTDIARSTAYNETVRWVPPDDADLLAQ